LTTDDLMTRMGLERCSAAGRASFGRNCT